MDCSIHLVILQTVMASFSSTFPSLFICISVIVSYILFRSLLNGLYWKHTWNMQRYEGNLSIVTLQHVIHKQLVWQAVVEFQITASQPGQYLLPDMQLNMVVLMEKRHGNLRLILILMTTYKLTFSMSMLSVLLLLKEIHHPNQQLKNGPQSTNWDFLSVITPFFLMKKIKLTRLVCYALVYKYS